MENLSYPVLRGAASILLSVGAGYLGAGFPGTLGLQALLFVLLGGFKYLEDRRMR